MSDTISEPHYDELPEDEKLMVIGMHPLARRRWNSWFVSYLERRAGVRVKLDDRLRSTLQTMVQLHGERPFRELLVHWLEDPDVVRMVGTGEIRTPIRLFISDAGERTRRRPSVEAVDTPARYERRDAEDRPARLEPVAGEPTMADEILSHRSHASGTRDAGWYHHALEEEMGGDDKDPKNGS